MISICGLALAKASRLCFKKRLLDVRIGWKREGGDELHPPGAAPEIAVVEIHSFAGQDEGSCHTILVLISDLITFQGKFIYLALSDLPNAQGHHLAV